MAKVRTALVIGGGVAGPVGALALHKAGIEATVYEAYPNSAEGVGGTLALAPNGQAALELVGVREAVVGAALPIPRTVMSFNGKEIKIPPLVGLPPLQIVRRADLHQALHGATEARGIQIEYGKRLESIADSPAGVTARFSDGTSATADILIGADGIHSTVRTMIDPAAPGPGYTGMLGFEAVIDRPVPSEPGEMFFSFGKRAYYLFWSLPDGRTHWGANLPQDKPMRLTEARAVPAEEWLSRLAETYGGDDPGGDLVRAIRAGRVAGHRKRHRAGPVPARPARHAGRVRRVRTPQAPEGGADHFPRGQGQPDQGARSGAQRLAAVDHAPHDENRHEAGAKLRPRPALPHRLGRPRRIELGRKYPIVVWHCLISIKNLVPRE